VNVLIIGAGGQVGRALAAAAPPRAEVVALSRRECDLSSDKQIEDALTAARPAIVFNAAAYTAVDRAESEVSLAERVNAVAPAVIARAARAAGARTVHLSTDFVFDGYSSRPYHPDDHAAPLGVYGKTKLAGERAVLETDPDALIVRTAWVYAPTGSNFVNTMLRLMRERDEIRVVSDQVGTPTRAASLAAALWMLAESGVKGTHHFTDAGVASWYDFAVAIEEEARSAGLSQRETAVVPISTAEYPRPAPRPRYSVLEKSATWSLLPAPPPHWRESLRRNLRDFISHV
jgi:dTDP-4-dehydrorhamnose reductase